MAHNTPSAWSITKDDLPSIKKLLAVILGDQLSSSLRLEVFSRLAGYRTFASLRSRLENFTDLQGESFPVQLHDHPFSDPEFFAKLSIEARRHLAEVEETGLTRLIIAGLHKSQHPIFGSLGVDENTTLDDLRVSCEHLFHPSTVGRQNSPLVEEHKLAAIVVTPENIRNIRVHSELSLEGSDSYAVYAFDFSDTDLFPRQPSLGEIRTTQSYEELANLLAGRKVYAYSTKDLFRVKEILDGQDGQKPVDYIQLKDAAAALEDLPVDTDLFTLGSMIECDIPSSLEDARPEDAMFWMLDILTYVHAYQNEDPELSSVAQ